MGKKKTVYLVRYVGCEREFSTRANAEAYVDWLQKGFVKRGVQWNVPVEVLRATR